MDHQKYAGKTPLHEAAETGQLDFVKKFISSGANINILDNEGNTAFDLGKKHIEVASYLGHAMGKKYITDFKYEDALKVYKELLTIQQEKLGGDHSETSKTRGYLSAVQTILFDWAKHLNAKIHDGKTPLQIAADKGDLENVKAFVSMGAKLTICGNDGKTAFDLAKKHIEVVTYLGHAMGVRFQNEDKYENAMQIYTELLEVQEEVLGCDHSDTSKTRELISAVENMLNLHVMKNDGHVL